MRRVIAAILLACLGIMLPGSASPIRVCLLDKGIFSADVDAPCCPDCKKDLGEADPCCMDLAALPETPAPPVPPSLPPVPSITLQPGLIPLPVFEVIPTGFYSEAASIRGPGPPAAWRAVLGVWRL